MAHAQPRRQSSNIWDNFTRSDDKLKATCNICQAVLACRNYGTSSLIYHTKHKHGKDQQVDKPSPSTYAKRQKVLPFRFGPRQLDAENSPRTNSPRKTRRRTNSPQNKLAAKQTRRKTNSPQNKLAAKQTRRKTNSPQNKLAAKQTRREKCEKHVWFAYALMFKLCSYLH